jgi:protein-arginine kinase activator protein McsA
MALLRPICKQCNKNPCAVNYIRDGVKHYRSICDGCGKSKSKPKTKKTNWELAGYKKKPVCDICGFKSLYQSQITVFHIDGDLRNTNFSNLRSICLNCVEVVKRKEVTWKRGDLQVDY